MVLANQLVGSGIYIKLKLLATLRLLIITQGLSNISDFVSVHDL